MLSFLCVAVSYAQLGGSTEEIELQRSEVVRDVFSSAGAEHLRSDASCEDVRNVALRAAALAGEALDVSSGAFMERAGLLFGAEAQHQYDDPPMDLFFGPVVTASKSLMSSFHLLSLLILRYPGCIKSAARSVIHRALVAYADTSKLMIETMWWMIDIGHFSNTNSPAKHLQQIFKTLQAARESTSVLVEDLPGFIADSGQFWGHEENGMFINSTVYFRRLFPDAALVDKGLLRALLRLIPVGSSLADFGALDGQYSAWLNDTGLISAYAFDGVKGVAEITRGRVAEVDLSEPFSLWRKFDWVMSVEVAEHIAPERQHVYLQNLAAHAVEGLVISWAPPHVAGEGHVNCKTLDESRAAIEKLGFQQDIGATEQLREVASLTWIAESIALYRRVSE